MPCAEVWSRQQQNAEEGLVSKLLPAHANATVAHLLTRTTPTPPQVVERECGIELPPQGDYAVGQVFLPREDPAAYDKAKAAIHKVAANQGHTVLGWRRVPTDNRWAVAAAAARLGCMLGCTAQQGQSHATAAGVVWLFSCAPHAHLPCPAPWAPRPSPPSRWWSSSLCCARRRARRAPRCRWSARCTCCASWWSTACAPRASPRTTATSAPSPRAPLSTRGSSRPSRRALRCAWAWGAGSVAPHVHGPPDGAPSAFEALCARPGL